MSAWWLIPAFVAGGAVVYGAFAIYAVRQASQFWR